MKTMIRMIALVLITSFMSLTHAKTFDKLVVFGDSLSETGNMYRKLMYVAPKPPYYKGHFTNGLSWSEHLIDQFPGTTLEDHSFSTAHTGHGSLAIVHYLSQIEAHLASNQGKNFENTLHVSFIGNVNYLELLGSGSEVTSGDVSRAVADINMGLQNLINAGAKNLFVLNLPNPALTPLAIAYAKKGNEQYGASAHAAVTAHNKALAEMIEHLQMDLTMKNSDVMVELIDTYGYFADILDELNTNPDTQTYLKVRPGHKVNTTENCWVGDYYGSGTVCDFPDEYVYWDHVHPTTAFYKAIALKVKDSLISQYGFQTVTPETKLSAQQQAALDKFIRITS